MTVRADGFPQRVAQKWFMAAIHWYIEKHQGCPRCRGRHCVFRARWGSRTEYRCTACDFSAAFDESSGLYAATDNEPRPTGIAILVDMATTPAPW
jgi:hypothetical protein